MREDGHTLGSFRSSFDALRNLLRTAVHAGWGPKSGWGGWSPNPLRKLYEILKTHTLALRKLCGSLESHTFTTPFDQLSER
jgi:hypothetical protein